MTVSLVNIFLSSAFDWIIETSVMASILVVLILCVKVLLRSKLTPRWHYLLWMILIVRLLLPWSPGSSYSIYSLLSSGYKTTPFSQNQSIVLLGDEYINKMKSTANSQAVKEETASDYTTLQSTGAIKAEFAPKEQQKNVSFPWYTIASYIWIAGIVVLGSATYFINRRLHRYIQHQPIITEERVIRTFERCKESMDIQQHIPLVLAGKTASPTVFGFFRPKVLLSEIHMNRLNEQQLQHIFYHELAHIKRKDVGVNWLMHTLLLLNWFNPILWYAYSCMREDQELACDALALTFIDPDEQNAYGHTILSLLEHYPSYYQVPGIANLSRNKKMLKRRIIMVKNFQKKSYRWSALGVVAIVAVSSLALLNAHAEEPTKQQKEQTSEEHAKQETGKKTASSVEQIENDNTNAEAESNEFDPKMKQFIAEKSEEFKNTTDINEYSAKLEQLSQELNKQYTDYDTVDAQYDFKNLRLLILWGDHFSYVIEQEEQQGIDTAESIDVLKRTFEYTKQLLNDLDVLINKNGKGETFGLLHQLDGEHVIEFEKFIWGERGRPESSE